MYIDAVSIGAEGMSIIPRRTRKVMGGKCACLPKGRTELHHIPTRLTFCHRTFQQIKPAQSMLCLSMSILTVRVDVHQTFGMGKLLSARCGCSRHCGVPPVQCTCTTTRILSHLHESSTFYAMSHKTKVVAKGVRLRNGPGGGGLLRCAT